MAQRYGGPHSPSDPGPDAARGGDRWTRARVDPGAGRVNALFVAPVPLLLTAFFREPLGLALNLVAFGVLMAAAFLTREGLKAEAAYAARAVARRPALPRKLLGSLLTGAGLAVAGAANPLAAAIFFVLGAGLHLMAFGIDPLRGKGARIDRAQSDRVDKAVGEGAAYLREMQAAIAATGDRALSDRATRFAATAREMFDIVHNDPADLTAARRWLGVYLMGARDAARKYADLAARRDDPAARAEFMALLDELESGFSDRSQKLLTEDRGALEIEIEVLRERLARDAGPGTHATRSSPDQ